MCFDSQPHFIDRSWRVIPGPRHPSAIIFSTFCQDLLLVPVGSQEATDILDRALHPEFWIVSSSMFTYSESSCMCGLYCFHLLQAVMNGPWKTFFYFSAHLTLGREYRSSVSSMNSTHITKLPLKMIWKIKNIEPRYQIWHFVVLTHYQLSNSGRCSNLLSLLAETVSSLYQWRVPVLENACSFMGCRYLELQTMIHTILNCGRDGWENKLEFFYSDVQVHPASHVIAGKCYK